MTWLRHCGAARAAKPVRHVLFLLVIACAALIMAPSASAGPTASCTVNVGRHIGWPATIATQHGGGVTTWGAGNSPQLGARYVSCSGRTPSMRLFVDNAGNHDYYMVYWGVGWTSGTWYTNRGNWMFPTRRNQIYRLQITACDQHWYGDHCFDTSPGIEISTFT